MNSRYYFSILISGIIILAFILPCFGYAPLIFGDIQTGNREPGPSAMYNRGIVKDSGGWLYAVYRDTQSDTANIGIKISRSTDGGLTWEQEWQEVTDTSHYGRDELISGCSMAIDEYNNLYVVWHRYQYSPTHHSAYFRKCSNTRTSPTWDPIIRIYTANIKDNDSGISIDSTGYIWIITGGPSNWKSQLWKSDSVFAAGGTFTNYGCPSSGSCQGASICIDKAGNIHCTYYDNGMSSSYAMHRVFDGSSWGTVNGIGNGSSGGRDHNCGLAADDMGNVHIFYGNNIGDFTSTWHFMYRKWDPVDGMGYPIEICNFPTSLYDGVTNRYISNICCNEITGQAFVLIRDLNEGGAMCLYQKELSDTIFTLAEVLTPPDSTSNYYYEPRMRGALYPSFNKTGISIDMSWTQDRSSSPHEKFYRYTLSEGPYLLSTFPPSGSIVSIDTTVILLFEDPDSLDPFSAEIEVNSVPYNISDTELSVTGDSLIYRPSAPWPEDTITVVLTGIDDALGHGSPDTGTVFNFVIDKSPPVIAYRDPEGVLTYMPGGMFIEYEDSISGTGADNWYLYFSSVDTITRYSDGVICEGDTLVIFDFSSGHVDIFPDETTWVEFGIWDNPDIGPPNLQVHSWWFITSTGIEEPERPENIGVEIFPNPFNASVTISIGAQSFVFPKLKIFDIEGRMIHRMPVTSQSFIFDSGQKPGGDEGGSPDTGLRTQDFIWHPGESIGSGVYFIRIDIPGNRSLTQRVLYLK